MPKINWLKIDPNVPQCCTVSIVMRKGMDPFNKEGGVHTCETCKKRWTRKGDEIVEAKKP